jgi:medium-chain acyl-[acyl-carrier-protein] hydrolase
MPSINSHHETKTNFAVMNGTSSYLSKIPETDTQTNFRLFCFPFAGAGASIYSNWHRYLPKNFEVCPIQLPGREERHSEKPFVDIISMVAELGEILKPYLAQPFAFFGHSMGALISFELTRHLRKLKQPMPESLFISARPAPQIQQIHPITYNLPDLEFIEELRKIQGTPEPVLQNYSYLYFELTSSCVKPINTFTNRH